MPANAPPPVRMAAGMLSPAARDSRPLMPPMIPAVSSMSRTQIQRGTPGRSGGADGSVRGEELCEDLLIISTAKSVGVTTLSIYSWAVNYQVHS